MFCHITWILNSANFYSMTWIKKYKSLFEVHSETKVLSLFLYKDKKEKRQKVSVSLIETRACAKNAANALVIMEEKKSILSCANRNAIKTSIKENGCFDIFCLSVLLAFKLFLCGLVFDHNLKHLQMLLTVMGKMLGNIRWEFFP